MSFWKLAQTLSIVSWTIAGLSGSWILLPSIGLAQFTVDSNQLVNQLKSGDRIRLTVTGFPELSGEQIILADGTLQLPLAGTITVAGQTPAAAVNTITTALRPYVRYPQVGLAILDIRAPRISVTGEVLHPGPRLLTLPEQSQNPDRSSTTGNNSFQTVSYALALAGGITPSADLQNVIIRRDTTGAALRNSDEPTRTEIKVNIWRAIQMGDLAADPPVIDGDEIVVPTAQISLPDQQRLLASTIAPNRITVQIAGEVNRPGSVQVAPTSGVSAAVAAAGGLNGGANRKLTLLRLSPSGKLERQTLAFGEDSEPLREGDVIVASKSTFSSVVDTIGKFVTPLGFFLNFLR
jgi:polysaccharide export outer membrane protein